MDKNDKSSVPPVIHRLPEKEMPEFHRRYGLWIFRGATGTTNPDSFGHCPVRYFEFYSLSHMYAGKGRLDLDGGKSSEIAPGEWVIITPGTRNRYGSIDGKRYSEDVVNFIGPIADMLMHSGVIANGVFSLGHGRRLQPILKYMADPAIDSQLQANIELQKLLAELYLKRNALRKSAYPLLEDLQARLQEEPEKWWTIREMAEFCHLCPDQFRRVFLKRTGMTPKIYVERLKISRAAEYLVASGVSIADVARHFGYQDQYHFSRRFKMVMGISPSRCRNDAAAFYPQTVSESGAVSKQTGPDIKISQ